MDGTEVSAESSGPLKCPSSAQDTERAVDQTHKPKSHSKTKDTDGPWSTSPHVERIGYENSSAQSAGKASKRKSASQSRKHSKAKKARTEHSDNEAHIHNRKPRKKMREKFHSERPRPGSDSPKSSDSVSGSSGSDQEQTCSSDHNSENGDHSDSGPSGYHSSKCSRSGSSSRTSSISGSDSEPAGVNEIQIWRDLRKSILDLR